MRFFFALRPDPAAAAQLGVLASRLAAAAGGRALSGHDVHLTLVFIGERPAEDAPMLHESLRDLPGWHDVTTGHPGSPPAHASLALSQPGRFGRSLLWLGPSDPGAQLSDWPARLAAQLGRRLHAAGIAFDERPLRLHLTLVRGARAASARDPAFPFDRIAHALPIVPHTWTLALGWAGANADAHRRYRWLAAPPATQR